MIGAHVDSESERREKLWEALLSAGGPGMVPPKLIRDLGIYGGAQGIWVNKEMTGGVSDDGAGVAVGVLHNGSSYADDLSDDGVIYHYPTTNRRGGRDEAESAALRNANRLKLPVFVITRSPVNVARRDVHRGWVTDIDDASAQCLIEFYDEVRPTVLDHSGPEEFRLEANRAEIEHLSKRKKRSCRFTFEVGKRCGWRCAVCNIELKCLLDAAHIRGVADKGSDDPRNGLILCKNHHAAFDAGLLNFHPETGAVELSDHLSTEKIGITVSVLPEQLRPHIEALRWRRERSGAAKS
jgi:putative restriction endonuclease